MPTASYSLGSLFTVHMRQDSAGRNAFDTRPVAADFRPNENSFDVSVVQFRDDGTFEDGRQLDATLARIRQIRSAPKKHRSASWSSSLFTDGTTVPNGAGRRESSTIGRTETRTSMGSDEPFKV